jgi:hypothetical protein
MDNRHGLLTDAIVTEATGTAEREAALKMLKRRWRKTDKSRLESPQIFAKPECHDWRPFLAFSARPLPTFLLILVRNAGWH